jgi:hypothetical protein
VAARPEFPLLFTFGIGGAAMVWSALQARDVTPREWLTLPLTFLYANLAEYWGHRGPTHHLKRGLRLVYERHTNYEFLHMSYHLRPDHPIARLGAIRRLERLHRTQHDPRLMAHRNFNITYPICDLLFGALQRG